MAVLVAVLVAAPLLPSLPFCVSLCLRKSFKGLEGISWPWGVLTPPAPVESLWLVQCLSPV